MSVTPVLLKGSMATNPFSYLLFPTFLFYKFPNLSHIHLNEKISFKRKATLIAENILNNKEAFQ